MKDLQVIDVHPTTRQVSFVIKPRVLTGISKLVQLVVLSLMNVPGNDVFDPDAGGGIPSLLGINIDPRDSTEVFAQVAQCIKKTESELISYQLGLSDPPEEKLKSLQIINIGQGASIDEILVKIRVINQLNQSMEVMV